MRRMLTVAAAAALLVLLCGATVENRFQVVNPSGVASPEYQTRTYLFKLAPQGDRSMQSQGNANWVADSTAAANSGGIVNLPADSVAWDEVIYKRITSTSNTFEPGAVYDSTVTASILAAAVVTQGDDGVARYPNPNDERKQRHLLLRMPLQHYLPAGWTVTSAYLRLESDGTNSGWGTNSADSLFCVLNTNAGDWAWWSGPKVSEDSTYCHRAASWAYQIQPATGQGYATTGHGYPARSDFPSSYADSFAWDPPLASRVHPVDFGYRGLGYCPLGATVTDGSALSVDIVRPVQKIVNGETNNGFWIMATDDASNGAASVTFSMWGDGVWNAQDADSTSNPYIVVTVSSNTSTADGPWVNKETAICFIADMAVSAGVSAWEPIFRNRGVPMTLAPLGGKTIDGVSGYCTFSDLATYFKRGHEIASESRYWDVPGGTSRGFAEHTYTAAGWDSLAARMSAAWLDSGLALNDGDAALDSAYYAAHRLVGKSIVCPNNVYTLNAVDVADSLGLLGLRTYFSTSVGPAFAPSSGDTVGAHLGTTTIGRRNIGLKSPRKWNQMLMGARFLDSAIFGSDGSPLTDSTAVKRMVRIMLDNAAYRYNEPVILYAHDLNTAGGSFSGGITAQQMKWIHNAVAESGIATWMTFGDICRYMRHNMAGPYDHPAYGGARWQAQADGMHYKGK